MPRVSWEVPVVLLNAAKLHLASCGSKVVFANRRLIIHSSESFIKVSRVSICINAPYIMRYSQPKVYISILSDLKFDKFSIIYRYTETLFSLWEYYYIWIFSIRLPVHICIYEWHHCLMCENASPTRTDTPNAG